MDELTNAISEMGIALTSDVWGVWFLIGAALVFFMQCGFAMVETGFTRAKNAGNIIMKNLMDFYSGVRTARLQPHVWYGCGRNFWNSWI